MNERERVIELHELRREREGDVGGREQRNALGMEKRHICEVGVWGWGRVSCCGRVDACERERKGERKDGEFIFCGRTSDIGTPQQRPCVCHK